MSNTSVDESIVIIMILFLVCITSIIIIPIIFPEIIPNNVKKHIENYDAGGTVLTVWNATD